MSTINYFDYGAKIFGFKAFRSLGFPKMMPQNVVFSITNYCNCRCKTCSIWEKYKKNPSLSKLELTTGEWIKTWKSMGKITFITFTGGEPFLRKDILKLLTSLFSICQPRILNIPHNNTLPKRFSLILESFLKNTKGRGSVTINLSLDGIGKKHDVIRGAKGNWEDFLESVEIIKKLKQKYSNLNLGVHTVISRWNVKDVPKIAKYVEEKVDPDVYIMEPAEERFELGTIGWNITPTRKDIQKVFKTSVSGRNHTSVISLVKKIYMDKYINGSGLDCYAGFNHCQITTNGNVWVCCIVADNEPMGNLKDVNFDFKKIWFSKGADALRRKVKEKSFNGCNGCQLACAANSSVPQNLYLVGKYFVKSLLENAE